MSSLKKVTKKEAETQNSKEVNKTHTKLNKKDAKKASLTSSKIDKNPKISDNIIHKQNQSQEDLNKLHINRTQSNIGKTFKRTIINKKLPVRLNLKNKQNTDKQQPNNISEVIIETTIKQTETDTDSKLDNAGVTQSNKSQKREIVLYKDENLGFGFIAGSEKPLVVRFVTPGIKLGLP